MKSARLCEAQAIFTQSRVAQYQEIPWGSGRELRISESRSESGSEEAWFFDEEGTLVGALFVYAAGLDLKPYPVLRETLSQLRPVLNFYLSVPKLPTKARMDTSSLYQTGDEKTTAQYLATGTGDHPILLSASFTIDPYVSLFSPYRREFLDRVRGTDGKKTGQGSVDQEPFASLQQFARGEAAQLAYCGTRRADVAADAYQKAINSGFSNKVRLAEAYHKLGLALEAQGAFEKAKAAMQQSLAIRPNVPEVLNNLGTIYRQLGDRDQARASFEKAVSLRPNYPLARFNLAESYESTNRRLAISEYETYLALVEGNPDEAERAARVKERVKHLQR
ncbi:MAG: tetratricopeptide repeat protein [Nitrospiraceae bacterium]